MKTSSHRKARTMPVTGISSLIVIFAVLCLMLLSVLAISTVNADERLEEKSSIATREYYTAEAEAEKCLALLRQGEVPEGVEVLDENDNGYTMYKFMQRINDTQILLIEASVKGSDYDIIKWQTCSDAQWDSAEEIEVWDGNDSKGED